MKISKKSLEEAWGRIENLGPHSCEPLGVFFEDIALLKDAALEREARIVELEESGRILANANKNHFDSARANYEALEVTQKRLEAVEFELKGARDLADFYRADAYNSDVEGMKREDRLKAMGRYKPSGDTVSKLMTIFQDQGELTMGQRVDQVVDSYEGLQKDLAKLRRTESELLANLRTAKDRIQSLEKEAGNYRIKIGEMEKSVPSLKLHDDLVPDWVKKQVEPTRWEIIAYPESNYRTTIGLRYHLVHCLANEEFEKYRYDCWKRVIDSAFYWADQERETRGDKRAKDLQEQIDGMVENGLKAAEERISEVYAKQEALLQDAFERGKKATTESLIAYLTNFAEAGISEEVTARTIK